MERGYWSPGGCFPRNPTGRSAMRNTHVTCRALRLHSSTVSLARGTDTRSNGLVVMEPYNMEYFMRFESKLVSRENVMSYLKGVYLIARRYFRDNVQFWASGSSPSLIQALDKILNTREDEGPPQVREEWYKVRHQLVLNGQQEVNREKEEPSSADRATCTQDA